MSCSQVEIREASDQLYAATVDDKLAVKLGAARSVGAIKGRHQCGTEGLASSSEWPWVHGLGSTLLTVQRAQWVLCTLQLVKQLLTSREHHRPA